MQPDGDAQGGIELGVEGLVERIETS
jgi:hypothetical protein